MWWGRVELCTREDGSGDWYGTGSERSWKRRETTSSPPATAAAFTARHAFVGPGGDSLLLLLFSTIVLAAALALPGRRRCWRRSLGARAQALRFLSVCGWSPASPPPPPLSSGAWAINRAHRCTSVIRGSSACPSACAGGPTRCAHRRDPDVYRAASRRPLGTARILRPAKNRSGGGAHLAVVVVAVVAGAALASRTPSPYYSRHSPLCGQQAPLVSQG